MASIIPPCRVVRNGISCHAFWGGSKMSISKRRSSLLAVLPYVCVGSTQREQDAAHLTRSSVHTLSVVSHFLFVNRSFFSLIVLSFCGFLIRLFVKMSRSSPRLSPCLVWTSAHSSTRTKSVFCRGYFRPG